MSQKKYKTGPHGGDVFAAARSLGVSFEEVIDFSANINPLGYPDQVRQAAMDGFQMLLHYPDPGCMDLKTALAEFHALAPEEIMVGNGSTELIYLLARNLKPERAVIVAPAFSEYQKALDLAEVPVTFHPTEESQNFTVNGVPQVREGDMVFLANPSNPAGSLVNGDRLGPWAASLIEAGALLVLDEAFIDFVEEASMKAWIRTLPNLIVLRSFTKFFGIPGIRLGCLFAEPDRVERLERGREPWSVNVMAQVMGRACLEQKEFIDQTRRTVKELREDLQSALSGIHDLNVFPGNANYLLVKLLNPEWTADRLKMAMLKKKVLIRDASNFEGLDQSFFRVAVRTSRENHRLVEALVECLEGK